MAVVTKYGEELARVPFEYAGSSSRFRATVRPDGPGVYEVLAYAYHEETGNTGLDRTTFIVRGE